MLSPAKSRGISMVEVTIVLAIMAILMSFALDSFQGMIANQRIRTVSDSLRAGLQLARVEALKRNAAVFFDMATLDSSWTIGCETPDANDADGDGLQDCPAVIRSEPSSAEGGASAITITPAAGVRATFTALGLVKRPANQDGTLPISQVDVTAPNVPSNVLVPLRVLLQTGGLSRVCNPAVTTAGDTRKC